MERRRERTVTVALCVAADDNSGDLHVATLYPVIPDKDAAKKECLRIIDESGEDYLYPADYFVLRRIPIALARRIGHPG
ncbi:MAG: hypothetical protein HYX69_13735 [Planctomycetia bacterium]|nr:hypothetical protein [Planctomycetia bacterium]